MLRIDHICKTAIRAILQRMKPVNRIQLSFDSARTSSTFLLQSMKNTCLEQGKLKGALSDQDGNAQEDVD